MRRIGLPAAVAAMALLFTACGGESGVEDAGTATTTADSGVATTVEGTDTTTADTGVITTAAGTDTTEPGSGDSPEMSGGSAMFTLAGETEDFDWFVCFYGDAAAEAENNDDLTFLGIARRGGSFPSMEGVEAQIAVARVESDLVGTSYTIFYTQVGSDGAQTNWQYVGDTVQLEGDRVTFEGELSPIIDNQPSDEASEMGALDATCSPNSVGS